jgi:hypothetical protein
MRKFQSLCSVAPGAMLIIVCSIQYDHDDSGFHARSFIAGSAMIMIRADDVSFVSVLGIAKGQAKACHAALVIVSYWLSSDTGMRIS